MWLLEVTLLSAMQGKACSLIAAWGQEQVSNKTAALEGVCERAHAKPALTLEGVPTGAHVKAGLLQDMQPQWGCGNIQLGGSAQAALVLLPAGP